ncbi:MAG: hypothetical protein CMQ19_08295 [Gammaproteobacteria bacterium]|nr:hypothetical protein [Gammaproteobacteria bacterium]
MSMTKNSSEEKVVVIGGGMGGMASALQLRAQGHAVALVEKNEYVGGIAASFEENGVRGFYPLAFGDYPSFESLFEQHDKEVANYVDVIEVSDMCTRFIYDDKTSLDLGDLESTLASLKERNPEHATQYQQLYDYSKEPGGVAEIFADVVAEHIKDEALQMAINFKTSLLGESPYSTSSLYLMILNIQETWGSFTAPGGMGGLVEALEKLMLDVGIVVIKGDAVTSLGCNEGKVKTAILQSGRKISCSHLVSNISPHMLHGRLLPDEYAAKSQEIMGDIKYSPSVFSYHFTTGKRYSNLPAMMVIFPQDLRKHFSQVYDEGVMPDELLLGVYRAGFYDPSMSPEDGDHFSVYLSVPNLKFDIPWEELSGQLVDDIRARLEEYLLPNLSENLLDGFYRTPLDMESKCSLPFGAGFGRQVTKLELGKEFFSNEETGLSNLHLVGHQTMPGPGLNAVLMSAQFATAAIPAPVTATANPEVRE